MPRIDASVRRPRPVDFAANIRAAREASDERQGKGPLMSDDTIRADLLSMPAPDVEQHKIRVERQELKIWESGIVDTKVMEALNIKLTVAGIPTDVNAANASPAAAEAANQLVSGQPQTNTNGAINGNVPPSPVPLASGQPTGMSQPEANAGKEIAGALFAGQ